MKRVAEHFTQSIRQAIILGVLAFVFVFYAPDTEETGDNVQIILPVLALGCEALNGRAVEYAGRVIVMELAIHLPKNLLGDAAINARPDGGWRGFPSGHTTAATMGATTLITRCVKDNFVVQGVIGLSAAFVGGSRIEADRHYLWQVIAGAVTGWFIGWLPIDFFGRFRRLWRKARDPNDTNDT